jgi:hypothetical protein
LGVRDGGLKGTVLKSCRTTAFVLCAAWSAILLCAGTASAGITVLDQTVVNAGKSGSVAGAVTLGETGALAGNLTDWSLVSKGSDGSNDTVAPSATEAASASTSDVTVRISGLPEPSAWILALVGFAGLGLGAFRKRKPRLASGLD